MVFAIMQAAAAHGYSEDDPEQAGQASFFGFIGIAIALVFASKCFSSLFSILSNTFSDLILRPWRCLWNC